MSCLFWSVEDTKRRVTMRYHFPAALISLSLLASVPSQAQDGAALYKAKCAGCHGPNGEGKQAVKAPALKGTALDVDKIVDHLTNGESTSKPPHNKGMSGLTADKAKAIADYVKSLK